MTREKWALLVVLLCGLLLRVYSLGTESLWVDEGYQVSIVTASFAEMMNDLLYCDNHPPLYAFILRLWVALFGSSEVAIRFPSVIFGTLSIFIIYRIGAVLFDEYVGIVAALIVAFSEFQIHYSQEARSLALLGLLSLLSYYYFIIYLKQRTWLTSVCYIIYTSLLMYTHIYGIFLIFSQNIIMSTISPMADKDGNPSLKHWILLQGILCVLFIPWAHVMVRQVIRVQSGLWIPQPSFVTILSSLVQFSGSILMFLFLFLLTSFALLQKWKNGEKFQWKVLFNSTEKYNHSLYITSVSKIILLLWLFFPIIFPFLISQVTTPIYRTRYIIGSAFAFYLFSAKSIKYIRHNKYIIRAFTVCFIVISFIDIFGYYSNINKERWRDLVYYIDTNAKTGDVIIFTNSYSILTFNYYSKRHDYVKKSFIDMKNKSEYDIVTELNSMIKGHNRIWVVDRNTTSYYQLIIKKLEDNFILLLKNNYSSITYTSHKKYTPIRSLLFVRS